MTVVVAEAKEGLEFLDVLGNGPVLDCLDLLWVHCNAFGGDDMAKVLHRFLEKFAFGYLAIHLMFPEEFEDLSHMVTMFFFISTVNKDVINVDNDKLIKMKS